MLMLLVQAQDRALFGRKLIDEDLQQLRCLIKHLRLLAKAIRTFAHRFVETMLHAQATTHAVQA
jgi:hypothetical protein